jgi:predicted ABC-class ATPase
VSTNSWNARVSELLADAGSSDAAPDYKRSIPVVNTYIVPTFDRSMLLFSIPVLIRQEIAGGIPPEHKGTDGVVWAAIEHIKSRIRYCKGLGPIAGAGTMHPSWCEQNIEPITVVASRSSMGSQLWKADRDNFIDDEGLHLLIRGAFPHPGPPGHTNTKKLHLEISALIRDLSDSLASLSDDLVSEAALLSADQKLLREMLPKLGIVAFIGDSTGCSRQLTRYRPHHRLAGPRVRDSVPFFCPENLDPVEITLPVSGERITGLAIRRKEVFAVAGSNAQGKTTFLEAVIAGQDDHAPGDGREHLVTVENPKFVESGENELMGADLSLFFRRLPSGRPSAFYGKGSGSMVMAHEFTRAVRDHAPIILFDEDRAAANLLVPCCAHTDDIEPLAVQLSKNRNIIGESTLIFAVATMDFLTTQADRILLFDRYHARGIPPARFKNRFREHLAYMDRVTNEKKEISE